MRRKITRNGIVIIAAVLAMIAIASFGIPENAWSQSSGGAGYHLVKKVVLGGEGGWDYFTADPVTHRIFIGRGTYVMVVDPDGNVVGKIDVGESNEAHAVEFAPDLKRAFTSNGSGGSVTIFDPATSKVISEVKVPGRDTDGILYDPASKRVFTFNGGKGNDATAIDAVKGVVVGSIPLAGKPETAQSDGEGHIFVNMEEQNLLKEIDAKTLNVVNSWPLAPCESPAGQAIDTAHKRLIIGCRNNLMAFVDYSNGKVVATVTISPGNDANRFDPATQLAFSSSGDGTITVAHEDSPNNFTVVQTITTMRGARTMALDAGNHNIYTVTTEFGSTPAPTPEHPRPRPPALPNTFTLLIFSR